MPHLWYWRVQKLMRPTACASTSRNGKVLKNPDGLPWNRRSLPNTTIRGINITHNHKRLRLSQQRRRQACGVKGSRTPDLLNAIQALYQLSYDPKRTL